MDEFVEPDIRGVVAKHFGVGVERLGSHASLRDDLGADSLGLVELALAIECEFAIAIPEHVLEAVRTYGDLANAVGGLIRARLEGETRAVELPQRIRVRIVSAAGGAPGSLERTGWVTDYTVQAISDDALRAGRGAQVDIVVAASTAESFVRAERRFDGLRRRGVLVTIGRAAG